MPHPAGLAKLLAAEWFEISQRDLRSLALSGPTDCKLSVTNLTTSWLEHRPSALADSVLSRIAS